MNDPGIELGDGVAAMIRDTTAITICIGACVKHFPFGCANHQGGVMLRIHDGCALRYAVVYR